MELYLHNHKIKTVFGLLGEKENDITFSIGWALSRCDEFALQFLKNVFPKADARSCKTIRLQQSSKHGGFTDIEIKHRLCCGFEHQKAKVGNDSGRRYSKKQS